LQARTRNGEKQALDFAAPEYFLRKSIRHARDLLAKLNDNETARWSRWQMPFLAKKWALVRKASSMCRRAEVEQPRPRLFACLAQQAL
jgi:hypothetical protein